jgi:hypothetical protein
MKIKLFSAVLLIASVAVAQTDEQRIVGKWAADSRTKGGLATLLIFSNAGAITNVFGVLVDFKYRVEGNTINTTFTDGETGKVEKFSKPYKIVGDKLTENPDDPTNRVEMKRVGTAKPGAPAIVGVWTYKHYVGTMAMMQYTSGGLAQLSVPMQTSVGRYKILNNELTIEFEGHHLTSTKRKFLLSGDHLVLLADGAEHESKFTRVVP